MAYSKEEVYEKIKQFVVAELIRDEKYPLKADEEIIAKGLIDSFSLAELGVYVEEVYDIFIPDADLTVENMGTLNKMVMRVMRDME